MKLSAKIGGCLATTSIMLSACSSTPADLHGLPEDDAERATLCGRSAVVYATIAETEELPDSEQQRRTELLQDIVSETDFFSAVELSEDEGRAILGDVESTLSEGNWLTTLNNCKAAYELGDAEPVPEMAKAPADKAAACGAAALIANLDGKSVMDVKNMLEDPQAAYFLTVTAMESGGDTKKANAALEEQVTRVVGSGAVGTLLEQCLVEYPKAKMGQDVTLPKADDTALVACVYNAELIQADDPLKDRAEAMSEKLDAHPSNMMPAARADELKDNLYSISSELGTPPDVLKACEARFK